MDAGNHRLLSVLGKRGRTKDEVKNGASPKSHTSRGNIKRYIFYLLIILPIVMQSCLITSFRGHYANLSHNSANFGADMQMSIPLTFVGMDKVSLDKKRLFNNRKFNRNLRII